MNTIFHIFARRTRMRWAVVLIVCAMALGARFMTIARAHNVARDSAVYLYMGKHLTDQPWRQIVGKYDYHPMYPAIVAFWAHITQATWPDGWVTLAQVVSACMSMVGLVSLYYIANRIFGRHVALWTLMIAGLSRPLTGLASDALSDWTALSFSLLAIACAMACAKRLINASWAALPLAGVCAIATAGGYLTRPEHLLAGAIAMTLILIQDTSTKEGLTMKAGALVIFLTITSACIAPYIDAIGTLSQKKSLDDFVLADTPAPLTNDMPLVTTTAGQTPGAQIEGARFGRVIWRLLDRSLDGIGIPASLFMITSWGIWLALGLGAKKLKRFCPRPRRQGLVVMIMATAVMVPVLAALENKLGPGYVSSRHSLMAMLLLMPCAGAGLEMLVRLAGRLGAGNYLRQVAKTRLGALVVISIAMFVGGVPCLHRGRDSYRHVGKMLRGQGAILCDDARIALYASAPAEQFIRNSPIWWRLNPQDMSSDQALLGRIRGTNSKTFAVVAFSQELLRHLPEDPVNVPLLAGLEPIDLPNFRTRVYAYKAPDGTQQPAPD